MFETLTITSNDVVTKKQKVLVEGGPFDEERIYNHVDKVNVVYQAINNIQLTLAPDLSCCPHGHAYLPRGLIPTEFAKYTNVVEIRKTVDAHLKREI